MNSKPIFKKISSIQNVYKEKNCSTLVMTDNIPAKNICDVCQENAKSVNWSYFLFFQKQKVCSGQCWIISVRLLFFSIGFGSLFFALIPHLIPLTPTIIILGIGSSLIWFYGDNLNRSNEYYYPIIGNRKNIEI